MLRPISALLMNVVVITGCLARPASSSSQSDEANTVVVLFQDDFSSPTSGWQSVNDPGAQAGYDGEAFRFQIIEPERYYWSTPGLNFRDIRLRVFVTKLSGDDIGTYGAICRYRNAENFYFFTITGDGFYAIGKFEGGAETLIGMNRMQSGPSIMQGSVTNHLSISCVGQTLSMAVNGAELMQVKDDSFLAGDIGLIVGALSLGDLAVTFENLSITTP